MRIIEVYPPSVKIFKGRGPWALFLPLRLLAYVAYRFWLSLKGDAGVPVEKRYSSGDREGGSGRARIISVGNLEVGGGGKTPCTIALAEAIMERGGYPVVVTRGYRGAVEHSGKTVVVSAGHGVDLDSNIGILDEAGLLNECFDVPCPPTPRHLAQLLGDEVVLYRERGIPVVIDAVRARGVGSAMQVFCPTDIILDDAFQHTSVRRDLDILLLDAGSPFGDGRLLPLGSLRERPDAVQRADAIIFTRAAEKRIPEGARTLVEDKRVFFAVHKPVDLYGIDGRVMPLSYLEGRRMILFSGIFRPASFEELVQTLGAEPEVTFRFADHHDYSLKDIERMLREAKGEVPFLTTEKDWCKASGFFPPGSEVLALRIKMEIEGIEALLYPAPC